MTSLLQLGVHCILILSPKQKKKSYRGSGEETHANPYFSSLESRNHHVCCFKDSAYYLYCAYVLLISRYSGFLSEMVTNTGIFLRGLKLSGESRS